MSTPSAARMEATDSVQNITDAEGTVFGLVPGLFAVRVLEPTATPEELGLRQLPGLSLALEGWVFGHLKPAEKDWLTLELARLEQLQQVEFATPLFKSPAGNFVFPTEDILVGLLMGVGESEALDQLGALLAQLGVDVTISPLGTPASRMRKLKTTDLHGLQLLSFVEALAESDALRFAESDVVFQGGSELVPTDSLFSAQWGLHNSGQSGGLFDMDMDLPEAWDVTTGNGSILIAIIDVGVDQVHPDINQMSGVDVTSTPGVNGEPVGVFDNHGTAVAGCATARLNNGVGIVGVAPSCRTFSIRTMAAFAADGSWFSQSSWTVTALVEAQNAGVRVTNNSNWYGFTSSAIGNEYASSRAAGIVHFASAGNFSTQAVSYPGRLSSVNAVAAINRVGNKTGFSSYGTDLSFTGPGEDIETTDRTGADGYGPDSWTLISGTSFSCPQVAGVAALMLSLNPAATASEVEQAMIDSATDLGAPGFDAEHGWGLPNAAHVLLDCGAESFCSSLANSTGFAALISSSGSTQLLANDLSLTATNSVPNQFGVFFYGVAGTPVPFGDGLLCAQNGGTGIHRLRPLAQANGSGVAQYAVDYTSPPMDAGLGQVQPGSTWTFQYWYRDPFAGASGFNLSDALTITFCP